MLTKFEKGYTAVFLGDAVSPEKLILLKRASNKKLAPDLYAGIGGKLEENETEDECVIRELAEETGITNVPMTEFARIILNQKRFYSYFHGIYPKEILPECNEGELEWVTLSNLFRTELIPTLRLLLKEWKKRNWKTDRPFTLYLERDEIHNLFGDIKKYQLREGLHL